MTTEPLDLDEAAAILADNGIDGPDLPYNPRALAAMRTADALLAELVQARAEIERLKSPIGQVVITPAAQSAGIPPQVVVDELWRAGWRPPGGTR